MRLITYLYSSTCQRESDTLKQRTRDNKPPYNQIYSNKKKGNPLIALTFHSSSLIKTAFLKFAFQYSI
ncbi:hypothetical protein EXE23_05540 [Acinetobacter venetianus]|nr:hypothetical protein EXE23_05540 [Acinetobacter venetianus]